ncbi:hypothetical protein AXG93_2446s1100 [Marchantia polymorpha subsp. ruderalis]|uniref:Uncharacterized protein n=1 Tax=Marchantia polymorpha subsp. ruderalis TaxID=1480154 RepID=A0A176W6S2_MARPO|nr:hypothetical protein AXG93_2446s1100 [Marchantia polymorpha subsp. ruderalis]
MTIGLLEVPGSCKPKLCAIISAGLEISVPRLPSTMARGFQFSRDLQEMKYVHSRLAADRTDRPDKEPPSAAESARLPAGHGSENSTRNGFPAPREFHVKVRSLLAPGSVTTHLTPRAFNIQGLRPPDEFGGMQIPDAEGAAEPFMSRRRCRHEEDSPDQISSAAGSDCASGKRRCSRCGKSEMTQARVAAALCSHAEKDFESSFSSQVEQDQQQQ